MKKIFLFIAICSFLFASCGNKSNNHNGTHTHEDGSIHTDHDATPTQPAQETFKVEADTTAVTKKDSLKQDDHSHEHTHDHGDGKPHKH